MNFTSGHCVYIIINYFINLHDVLAGEVIENIEGVVVLGVPKLKLILLEIYYTFWYFVFFLSSQQSTVIANTDKYGVTNKKNVKIS